jgi:hypothetical protein
MFFKNKRLKEIEMLQKEKQELLEIKEKMLNTNNPDFIDISNVYIWKVNGIKNIKFIIHMNFYINLKVIFYTLVCRL